MARWWRLIELVIWHCFEYRDWIVSEVSMGSAVMGTTGWVAEGASSGTVAFEVSRVVDLTIEEVAGTERHSRRGYELEAATQDGDSGAGAYDVAGRLIGVVFASGPDEDTTWVTASSEIEDFISGIDRTVDFVPCS